MNGINLIPAARRAARARGRQLRLWGVGAVLCGLGLFAAQGALWNAWRSAEDDPAPELERLAKDIAQCEQRDKASRGKVIEAKAAAQAAREVADQPDWGVLMAYIADKLGAEAMLDSLRLEPVSATTAAALSLKAVKGGTAAEPGRRSLVLTGIARSQDAASEVAIGLKRSELFQSVNLVETRRTVFMGGGAVAFRIECAVAGAGGGD